ncbi:hypothetical protein SERLADRAFT_464990 [Serpula lacrymans var. lacrymans S7.9]|uniref:Uncharacterized protein n=1 Tax=Serpula lacrymans var. lacrymans (strain S7.9) TaxID=578457 RepID=F8NUC2_SERL9|nr:uncharacterized protein SERLADRAFT_464990 [Serpula lacrymans var. lacrymans S7.9]EGO25196.1 hypothetical protein SERLADRAFT_464990 [Serpula lacrymans var. lacrymans S7.9]
MSVSVEYHSPSITEEAWRAMLREEDVNEAMEQGWSPNDIERVGRAWTGEGAEAYAKLFVSREDGNISKTAKDRPGKLRDIPKLQPGLPPISTSDSGDICQPLTPSQSLASISRSPEMPYTPLTPASSEISNSSSSGSPNLDLSVDGTCEDEYYTIHKRSPSEPCRTPGEAVSGRNRTATGTMYKGTISESSSGSDEAHTRNRLPGTGRGKKSAVDNGDPLSRGRGRGNEHSHRFSGPGISGGGGRRRRSGGSSIPSTRP